ncbi:DUF6232 family protein [Streptomyces sp. NPDC048604]|uniref:DUF6232 family protein n=1 Tax=Streptomyces sp. NPDC048604 TaxID=3365578 RepID=UPI003713AE2D
MEAAKEPTEPNGQKQAKQPAEPAARALPPRPAAPPRTHGEIELKVSKRLLWVDDAAYPLHNIARVYTFTLVPARGRAFWVFLKRIVVMFLVVTALRWATDDGPFSSGSDSYDSYGQDDAGPVAILWLVIACVFVFFLGDMLSVVLARSHFVLAVETNGPSTAVVTSRDRAYLKQLVHTITDSIDNPEFEFAVRVEPVLISKSENYNFGNQVNMYGGNGNSGVLKA